jgi:excisionase family DNA binding protein
MRLLIMAVNNKILTPNQVADLMMVSPATVRQWAAKGHLKALTTPGGHRRFRMSDVVAFAQKQGIILNQPDTDSLAIMVVDDDIQLAKFLKILLTDMDPRIQVEVVHDGFAAGQRLHIFKPDLILMDLMMPTMDGFETCKRIKADPETAGIKIVCMTGFATKDNVSKILALGADACLEKPLNEELIAEQVMPLLA